MSRTLGGNPLRNAAIRQGNPLPPRTVGERLKAAADRLRVKKGTRPYTNEDRARLLAPITISCFGGRTHAGICLASKNMAAGHGSRDEDNNSDRYAQRSDWADLDRL